MKWLYLNGAKIDQSYQFMYNWLTDLRLVFVELPIIVIGAKSATSGNDLSWAS